MRGRLAVLSVLLAISAAKSVEVADFVMGTGTSGWVVSASSYVSPTYPNGVSRLEIECANAAPDCSVVIFATSAAGNETQIASFAVVTTVATFSFAAATDFRRFRIETGGGVELRSVAVTLFPALRAIPISSLEGGVYAQDFNSLAGITAATGGKDWLNGITLPGWQAWKGSDEVTSFTYNGGKIKTGGLYALDANQRSAQRALGGYSTKEAAMTWGVAFTNDTDGPIRLVGVSCSAQQWGFANTVEHRLSLSCMVTNRMDWMANLPDGWRGVCDTVAQVFGSEEPHAVPVVTPVACSAKKPRLAPGEVLLLKWTIHPSASGYSALMAIDDVSITFVNDVRPFVIHVTDGGHMQERRFGQCICSTR